MKVRIKFAKYGVGEGGLEVPVNPTEKTALMLCVT